MITLEHSNEKTIAIFQEIHERIQKNSCQFDIDTNQEMYRILNTNTFGPIGDREYTNLEKDMMILSMIELCVPRSDFQEVIYKFGGFYRHGILYEEDAEFMDDMFQEFCNNFLLYGRKYLTTTQLLKEVVDVQIETETVIDQSIVDKLVEVTTEDQAYEFMLNNNQNVDENLMVVLYANKLSNFKYDSTTFVYQGIHSFRENLMLRVYPNVHEVWIDIIFPYLSKSDQLRFRQVSKYAVNKYTAFAKVKFNRFIRVNEENPFQTIRRLGTQSRQRLIVYDIEYLTHNINEIVRILGPMERKIFRIGFISPYRSSMFEKITLLYYVIKDEDLINRYQATHTAMEFNVLRSVWMVIKNNHMYFDFLKYFRGSRIRAERILMDIALGKYIYNRIDQPDIQVYTGIELMYHSNDDFVEGELVRENYNVFEYEKIRNSKRGTNRHLGRRYKPSAPEIFLVNY